MALKIILSLFFLSFNFFLVKRITEKINISRAIILIIILPLIIVLALEFLALKLFPEKSILFYFLAIFCSFSLFMIKLFFIVIDQRMKETMERIENENPAFFDVFYLLKLGALNFMFPLMVTIFQFILVWKPEMIKF